MATTDVSFLNDGGVYVPSVGSVPVVRGETVSFKTSDGGPALLYFSPDAAAVLSPKPTSPFAIHAAQSAVFTFTSSAPGAYSAYVCTESNAAPAVFPTESAAELFLMVDPLLIQPGFGITDNMTPGH
jgi:hypothetical protein